MGAFYPARDLSDADLLRYCEHEERRRPQLLAELSTWIDRTWDPVVHGSRDQLDGTLASITPLVNWFYDFAAADLPGIPTTVRLLNWTPSDQPPEESVDCRLNYVGLAVDSYAMTVVRRYYPGAEWRPLRSKGRVPDLYERTPALHVQGRAWIPRASLLVGRTVAPELYSPHRTWPRSPGAVVDRILDAFPSDVFEQDLPVDLGILPPPGRETPVEPWPPFVPSDDETAVKTGPALDPLPRPVGAEQAPPLPVFAGADFAMACFEGARISADGYLQVDEDDEEEDGDELEVLAAAGPALSTRGLHRALLALGFEYEGDGTPRFDRADVQYTFTGVEAALLVETFRAGGRLRVVYFHWLNESGRSPDTPTGRWLVQQVAGIAAQRGARLLAAEVQIVDGSTD